MRRYPDGREVCSPAELRRRKNLLLHLGAKCAVCKCAFTDYSEVELGHRESKGLGGAKRDDRMENLCLLHVEANRDMGSMSLDDYLASGRMACRG